jgi:hypothetical protein
VVNIPAVTKHLLLPWKDHNQEMSLIALYTLQLKSIHTWEFFFSSMLYLGRFLATELYLLLVYITGVYLGSTLSSKLE